jgi:dethiobiotin synthetase
MNTYFVTGIDTDIGKTIVCGLLARYLRSAGVNYITAKLVQTGCKNIAEDIATHRKIEGIALLPEDRNQATCPYIFKFPASPHLAAEMENREICADELKKSIDKLTSSYDCVLLEGAGGLMVPLTRSLMTADFVAAENYKLIVVSSGRLGSINHTLLTLEAAINRNIKIAGVIYNNYPNEHASIANDSKQVIAAWLKSKNIDAPVVESPLIKDLNNLPELDFSAIFRGVIQ